LINKKQADTLL